MKQIKLAKHAGFCYGVKRAVETTKKLKSENKSKNIFVLGELIHNSHVIKELEDLGIKTVEKLPENQTGVCIIRSHGASPSIIKEIQDKGFEMIDLTCPDVKKVQQKAIQLVSEDYLLLILGKSEHPEVIAIKANANIYGKQIFVIENFDGLKKIEDKIKEHKKVGVVIQTTQKIEFLKEVVNYLTPIVSDLRVCNTICSSTSLRQKEAINLAMESDLMVVVGSKKSANTSHLAELLIKITNTIHIEDDTELSKFENLIKKAEKIGITAGASTPNDIIEKVINKLNSY